MKELLIKRFLRVGIIGCVVLVQIFTYVEIFDLRDDVSFLREERVNSLRIHKRSILLDLKLLSALEENNIDRKEELVSLIDDLIALSLKREIKSVLDCYNLSTRLRRVIDDC